MAGYAKIISLNANEPMTVTIDRTFEITTVYNSSTSAAFFSLGDTPVNLIGDGSYLLPPLTERKISLAFSTINFLAATPVTIEISRGVESTTSRSNGSGGGGTTSNVDVLNFPTVQGVSIKTDDVGLAKDGTDATGVTSPTGATGIRGWLSSIYSLFLNGTAKTQVTSLPAIPAGTNDIGSVELKSGNGNGFKAEVYPYAEQSSWSNTDNALAVAALLGAFNGTNSERLSSTAGALHTSAKDAPYERHLTPSIGLTASTTSQTQAAVAGAIGYTIQANPNNTANVDIGNGGVVMLRLMAGQVEHIYIPSFTYLALSGSQDLRVTPIGRVTP